MADRYPATAGEIQELCISAGRPSLAVDFIKRRLSLDEVKAELNSDSHKAEAAEIASGWAKAFAKR